MGVQRYVLGIN